MGRNLSLVQFDACGGASQGHDGALVTVCNVHLESLDQGAGRRVEQLVRIFPIISSVCNGASPVVLCGDFNYNANNANQKEEACIPAAEWQDLSLDRKTTIGDNFPSKKYPPARFDRMVKGENVCTHVAYVCISVACACVCCLWQFHTLLNRLLQLLHQPALCAVQLERIQWSTFGNERLPPCASSAPVSGYLTRFGPKISDHLGLFARFLVSKRK